MKKNSLLILFLLVLSLVVVSCSPKTEAPAPQTPSETKEQTSEEKESKEKEFTVEELAKFNGENGAKAYVAVDGVVYDVTDVPQWNKGQHNGFTAGKDLTEEIKKVSPHGVSKLEGVPVVGKLVK